MATALTAPLTLEEFLALPDDGNKYEISEGELILVPPVKLKHSRIVRKVFKEIEASLDKSRAGEAYAEAGEILSRIPATMRIPDISLVSNQRINATAEDGYLEGAPELAVEVVSPSQSATKLNVKIRQLLQTGAKQVWVLYPETKTIHVHRPGLPIVTLEETDVLDGGDVLPGFSVKVADLFV